MADLTYLLAKCAHRGCGWDREWHMYLARKGHPLDHDFEGGRS